MWRQWQERRILEGIAIVEGGINVGEGLEVEIQA